MAFLIHAMVDDRTEASAGASLGSLPERQPLP